MELKRSLHHFQKERNNNNEKISCYWNSAVLQERVDVIPYW